MHPHIAPLPVITDAEFRVSWIAGFSAAALAQAMGGTLWDVYARAERLGFITPTTLGGQLAKISARSLRHKDKK